MDRNKNTSAKQRDGGVLIAIKAQYDSSLVPLEVTSIEHVLVRVKLKHKYFIFGCVYIPPASDIEVYMNHIHVVENIVMS